MSITAPVTLSGWGVRLEPLQRVHVPALQEAVADGDIGAINYVNVPGRDGIPHWVDQALLAADAGRVLPFVVVAGERVVGSTRFYDIDLDVPTVAIGYTFHAASVWRSHVNTANKRLMLGHAFDTLGAQSVALEVVETPPELKGGTATKRPKPAKLSTGIEIMVPEYISNGEKVWVNTTTGEFGGRAE